MDELLHNVFSCPTAGAHRGEPVLHLLGAGPVRGQHQGRRPRQMAVLLISLPPTHTPLAL
jgi:hypothetical protein